MSINGTEDHLIFFESFSNFLHTETSKDDIFSLSPRTKLELFRAPVFVDFNKSNLDFLLLFGRLADFLNVFDKIQNLGFYEVLDNEDLKLIEGNSVSSLFIKGLPMSVLDCILLQDSDNW